jgi:hypothetical protein
VLPLTLWSVLVGWAENLVTVFLIIAPVILWWLMILCIFYVYYLIIKVMWIAAKWLLVRIWNCLKCYCDPYYWLWRRHSGVVTLPVEETKPQTLVLEVSTDTVKVAAPKSELEMGIDQSIFLKVDCKPNVSSIAGLLSIRVVPAAGGKIIGMASRVIFQGQTCLMTNAHVWQHVINSSSNCLIEHKGITTPALAWDGLLYSGKEDLDVVLIKVPDQVWSLLGNPTPRKLGAFRRNASVMVYGFVKNQLNSSSGRAFVSDKYLQLYHACSTDYGFSGTPIFMGNVIVGIHIGIAPCKTLNKGTVCFFRDRELTETSTTDIENFKFVVDLPGLVESKNVKYRSNYFDYSVNYEGNFAVISKVGRHNPNQAGHWSLQDDFEETFTNIGTDVDVRNFNSWETGIPVTELVKVDFFNPGEKEAIFAKKVFPKTPSPQKRKDKGKLRDVVDTNSLESPIDNAENEKRQEDSKTVGNREKGFQQGASTSRSLESTQSTSGKKVKSVKKEQVCSTSVDVPTGLMGLSEDQLRRLVKLLSLNEHLLQSGVTHEEMQQLRENPSFSKPVGSETVIQVVNMSRKAEKIYNRICRSREFRKALEKCTVPECFLLQKKAFQFSMSPHIVRSRNPVQDFLSTCLLDTIANSSIDIVDSSLGRC